MLYPRSQETQLSPELFRHPGKEYRGAPFWSWNCKITSELIRDQIDMFDRMGFGGAILHARTGLDTPYLGDEFMAYIRESNELMKQRQMTSWLYDEDRYPSGAAGGLVTRDLHFRSRHVLLTRTRQPQFAVGAEQFEALIQAGQKPAGYYLASYQVVLADGCLAAYRRIDPAERPADGKVWHAYVRLMAESPWCNAQTYLDVLHRRAVERFIEVTYERYRAIVGPDFGGSVPAIFTDEPHMKGNFTLPSPDSDQDATLPFTDDLDESYARQYGTRLLDVLPEILWELPDGRLSVHRYQFRDHLAERFAAAFSDTIGAWCGRHNIAFTGHYLSERTLYSQTLALGGETMRLYRGHQIPGIDILADQKELTTAKQAASVARQYGREGVLSEMYGVTHWDFDFKGHKLQGDWQAALGVTVRVPHLAFMSMEGEAKRDWPAAISYQSPWYLKYPFIEDHFARVNTVLTRGQAVAKVGVIFPIESYWLLFGPNAQTQTARDQMDENYENLTRWLLNGTIDFDLISESLLPEECPTAGYPLQVGHMAYETIVVPSLLTIRRSTLERLQQFQAAGGQVIFAGEIPSLVDARPSDEAAAWARGCICVHFNRERSLASLQAGRTIEIRNRQTGKYSDNLFSQIRQDGANRFVFICHVNRKKNKLDQVEPYLIRLAGNWCLSLLDTLDGSIRPVDSDCDGASTCYAWDAYAEDSLLLQLEPLEYRTEKGIAPEMAASRPAGPKACSTVIPTPVPMAAIHTQIIQSPSGYELDEASTLLLDFCEYALDDEPWQEREYILTIDNLFRQQLGWPRRQDAFIQPWLLPADQPEHVARLRYRFRAGIPVNGAQLAIERPEKAQIRLNGQPVDQTVRGWFVDRFIQTVDLPAIRAGENVLELTIPFGRRTNLEWIYLLGDFGTRAAGSQGWIVPKPPKLAFGDITGQDLAFCVSNVLYRMDLDLAVNRRNCVLEVPHFASPVLEVFLDGESSGLIALAPHRLNLGDLSAGSHELVIKAYGNRYNCFGTLHNSDSEYVWYGPDSYRTTGSQWSDTYNLRPFGILSPVRLTWEG